MKVTLELFQLSKKSYKKALETYNNHRMITKKVLRRSIIKCLFVKEFFLSELDEMTQYVLKSKPKIF